MRFDDPINIIRTFANHCWYVHEFFENHLHKSFSYFTSMQNSFLLILNYSLFCFWKHYLHILQHFGIIRYLFYSLKKIIVQKIDLMFSLMHNFEECVKVNLKWFVGHKNKMMALIMTLNECWTCISHVSAAVLWLAVKYISLSTKQTYYHIYCHGT